MNTIDTLAAQLEAAKTEEARATQARLEAEAALIDALGVKDEGAMYYEIDTEAVQLADYLRADRILEAAEESLYDDIGEAAVDAFAANAEAMAELSSMLSAWAEKHLSGHYWKYVGKARELKVTAADVTAWRSKT